MTLCPSYTLSVCVCFCLVCCFVRSAWNWSPWKEASVRVNHLHLFVMKYGCVRSMFTIYLSPCLLRHSISTVDRFFFGMGVHRQSISTDLFLVWIHIDGRFRPIFGSNRRSIKSRPYFQVGESLSTVNIDRILKSVNPYRPSISTVTDRQVD